MKLAQDFKGDYYVIIDEHSNLLEDNFDCKSGKYPVSMGGEFTDEFLNIFAKEFANIKKLDFGNTLDGENTFLYDLKNLKELGLSFLNDVDTIVDFSKIVQLDKLTFRWVSKNILNLDSQKQLKHLGTSGYTGIDLTNISKLTSLESLYFMDFKIKSLKGIENLTNLKSLHIKCARNLVDISAITTLQNLKYLQIYFSSKLVDFSPIGELKELEVLSILDCKNLASIKFVEKMPKLEQLAFLGTTIVNDYDITPAKNIQQVFGYNPKYNVNYEEKAKEPARKSFSTFLK